MQKNRYKNILYFITIVIVATLGIQVYWNFKNYEAGKQQLINEVQISLDNAVDQYYEKLAKDQTIGFASKSGHLTQFIGSSQFDSIIKDIDTARSRFRNIDFIDSTHIEGVSVFRGKQVDDDIDKFLKTPDICDSAKIDIRVSSPDSVHFKYEEHPLQALTSKIVISINQESIELKEIDSLFRKELGRKNVAVDYGITYTDPMKQTKKLDSLISFKTSLSTKSKSSYLPPNSTLELFFTNTTRSILKKNLIGILLSFLLVGAVIGCLLYLLKIINQQKHLAELKNDLISNITHEFKTPIATISVALEGIQNFNTENDPDKTKKYVEMSSNQLGKLNTMVEKILETATLDSEELQLNLEEINLVHLIDAIAKKHQANTPNKEISFDSSHENIWKKIDVFHFENAINNIVDNAIKYGGDTISVHIKNTNPHIIIEIQDDGTSLTKANKDKIFEKFYRVPKGNTHDVKGFGIGLFYTKTIIEKHQGAIQLLLDNQKTNFKITLPNG
ncbi:sensor histidine kinase [Aquimarina sp. 2201CG14-23]|uniref:sensor histidine kinase n=1 Tax=Aquimarina mycalae TaxID=3040073 RepID=UPI0024781E73|nr:HAMP domain-containing sensor histidine kinase [Aquimarina sp. 2201CG14-23]MDH7445242.1 HAMP domain-containing sensor histidine kinase [Aquimarina sp. 2201CG14-23]